MDGVEMEGQGNVSSVAHQCCLTAARKNSSGYLRSGSGYLGSDQGTMGQVSFRVQQVRVPWGRSGYNSSGYNRSGYNSSGYLEHRCP